MGDIRVPDSSETNSPETTSEVKFEAATKKKREIRPWGSYEILTNGPGFQAKRLTVKVEKRLSLQWHRHRDETWVVARGTARVTVGEEQSTLGRGESMFVARNIHHRIENISSVEPLEIIEIQTGDYLGEDDIVRVEDDFGRAE
ncbi:MAG: phosphomannose isomerase type II C-terminal cupin domain [Chloroflexi bacterium]|nr:phosphomannose isomerase type II C-terminal cupin domain [Chloroflexota bacterium]MBT4141808.1 phosphomannose isomerase type II C-terminal cupin domain [Chloroflexota bacterium]MBT4341868.1 phosphomannose isomerase type II C-terminal cupin domain [Chloroflexota bacterium]MBT4943125.1 phosphomannose isomerase type II C-terminal cupin domain [Chloroflexota bacterium]MBT5252181.1 phosphomannose isomerase type II C-terminal cupin domain [Chloroflexota bacterium]